MAYVSVGDHYQFTWFTPFCQSELTHISMSIWRWQIGFCVQIDIEFAWWTLFTIRLISLRVRLLNCRMNWCMVVVLVGLGTDIVNEGKQWWASIENTTSSNTTTTTTTIECSYSHVWALCSHSAHFIMTIICHYSVRAWLCITTSIQCTL